MKILDVKTFNTRNNFVNKLLRCDLIVHETPANGVFEVTAVHKNRYYFVLKTVNSQFIVTRIHPLIYNNFWPIKKVYRHVCSS